MSARCKTTAVWAACSVLLAAAGMVNSRLAGHRQSAPAQSSQARNRPSVTGSQGAAPPPAALTTVLLGGFRGVFTDLLWIRAATLQQQGRFVELVQLAD